MKRDREEQEDINAKHMYGQPGWVDVVFGWDQGSKFGLLQDDRLEWDRCCSYLPLVFGGGQHNVGNRILPLGLMIKCWLWPLVTKFVDESPLHISIHDPCVWIDNQPLTPVEWAVHLDMLCDLWVEVFWNAGVSATRIPCRIHQSGNEDYMVRGCIDMCRQMEDGIMAMVWCCKQVTETLWHDNATTIAERMRRFDVSEWVEIRNELDYQLHLLHDNNPEEEN